MDRHGRKDELLRVRLDADLMCEVRELADERGRSVAFVVRLALVELLERSSGSEG